MRDTGKSYVRPIPGRGDAVVPRRDSKGSVILRRNVDARARWAQRRYASKTRALYTLTRGATDATSVRRRGPAAAGAKCNMLHFAPTTLPRLHRVRVSFHAALTFRAALCSTEHALLWLRPLRRAASRWTIGEADLRLAGHRRRDATKRTPARARVVNAGV